MERDQLEPILQEGEGILIEFKKSFSPSIVKEIVAFADTAGGTIFIVKVSPVIHSFILLYISERLEKPV